MDFNRLMIKIVCCGNNMLAGQLMYMIRALAPECACACACTAVTEHGNNIDSYPARLADIWRTHKIDA
eukprot:scaffold177381_cov38-Tisochrysis_lutea.AAC.2